MAKRLFRTYLAGGALATAVYFLTSAGTAGLVVWDLIVASMPVAILIGVWRFRPDRRAPWLHLATGLGIFAFGDVIWAVSFGGAAIAPSDIAYLVGYPLIAIGCLLLMRGDRRASILALVDASIGAVGLAVIVWIVVLSGGVPGTGPTGAALVNASYPVFDVLIVTLLVRLALADRSREPAYWWLVGGFSLMLATDLAYAWLLRGSPDAYSPFLDLGWLVSYIAIGAAALHPSMVHLTRREAPEGVLSPIDVVWLGIPLYAVPVLMLIPGHDRAIDQVLLSAAAMVLSSLVMVRIVSSAKDRDRAHGAARIAELEYRSVFDGSPVAVLKVKEGGEILDANPVAERLLEYDGGVRGRALRSLLVDPAVDGPRIRMSVTALIDGPPGANAAWMMRLRRGDGSSFWSSMNTSVAKDFDGRTLFGITTIEDVTSERAEEDRLRFRALHDPLTGLPNRDLLDEGLRRALARAGRGGTKVGVMFMDLDGFKDVNDRMGHAVGDELLRALAQRLESSARGGDIVARLGGDEFVIVVEDVRNDEQAEASVARFLEEVRRPVVLGGAKVTLDASVGLVVAVSGDTPDEILRRADSAMYEAKRAGRGGWRRFGAETSASLGA